MSYSDHTVNRNYLNMLSDLHAFRKCCPEDFFYLSFLLSKWVLLFLVFEYVFMDTVHQVVSTIATLPISAF